MKNLTEMLHDSLNESFLGTAGAIAGGLLGFAIFRVVMKSLTTLGIEKLNNTRISQLQKEIDDIESRLVTVLERNPEAYEYVKKEYAWGNGKLSGKSYGIQTDDKIQSMISDEDKREFDEILNKAQKNA